MIIFGKISKIMEGLKGFLVEPEQMKAIDFFSKCICLSLQLIVMVLFSHFLVAGS